MMIREKRTGVNISPNRLPVVDGQSAFINRGGAPMAVFADFRGVSAIRDRQDGKCPIVDDQHIHAGRWS
jgi:hypothetical protein